jgi:uncharacterized protein (TIGR03000 family)
MYPCDAGKIQPGTGAVTETRMRRVLAVLASFLFTTHGFAQPIVFPDNTTSDMPGGLILIRKGNQTTWSLGGAFLPRTVKVVTNTPEGKEIARFRFPSVFRDPYPAPMPTGAPASLQVQIPDPYGQIYVDGELVRTMGTSRQLESPKLPPGKAYPLRVRGAYVVGENFVIEDKEVLIRAGESTAVTFDGKVALILPLKKEWLTPPPQVK